MSDMGNCMSMHQVTSKFDSFTFLSAQPLAEFSYLGSHLTLSVSALGVIVGDGDQDSRRSDLVFSGQVFLEHLTSDLKKFPSI